jgi:restriction endonuclease S subunit
MLKLLIENTLVKVVGMEKEYKILGNYIRLVDERNRDLAVTKLLGVSISKKFIPSIANIVGTDLSNYKIVRTGQFAYGPVTSRNGEKISIAYLDEEDCIISSSYTVFEVENKEELDPEYLMLWFSRPEFDRYARYKSHGSVREIFDWNELCMVELPVPDIEKQRNIVKAYKTITDRIALKQKINDNLEAQAEAIYNEMIANNSTNGTMSTLGEISTIKTGKLNSEAAVINGIYPFFTCSQETYRTNTFSFDQEAVLLAGNNASAIYPLKIYCGKFDVYQRTYVISSNNRFVSNKQLYFVLKQQLNEFKGISSGTTTKFLTMKILTPIPVVIAPEDIATSFINITNKIFETIFQNQREIEHLRELQMIVLGELSRD